MSIYRISDAIRHEYVDAAGDAVSVEFKAGDFTPATDAEAVAVAHLVSAGLAEEVAEKSTKKKADLAADVPVEE